MHLIRGHRPKQRNETAQPDLPMPSLCLQMMCGLTLHSTIKELAPNIQLPSNQVRGHGITEASGEQQRALLTSTSKMWRCRQWSLLSWLGKTQMQSRDAVRIHWLHSPATHQHLTPPPSTDPPSSQQQEHSPSHSPPPPQTHHPA